MVDDNDEGVSRNTCDEIWGVLLDVATHSSGSRLTSRISNIVRGKADLDDVLLSFLKKFGWDEQEQQFQHHLTPKKQDMLVAELQQRTEVCVRGQNNSLVHCEPKFLPLH